MWQRSVGLAVALQLAGCATMTPAMPVMPMTPDGAPAVGNISSEQAAYITVGAVEMALAAALASFVVSSAANKGRSKGSMALISIGIGLLLGGAVVGALVARPPHPNALDWLVVTVPMGLGSIVSIVTLLSRRSDGTKARLVPVPVVAPAPQKPTPAPTAAPAARPPREVYALVFVSDEAAGAFASYAKAQKCSLTREEWSTFRADAAAEHLALVVEPRPTDEPVVPCTLAHTARGHEIHVAVE